jgi:hypothetical protein
VATAKSSVVFPGPKENIFNNWLTLNRGFEKVAASKQPPERPTSLLCLLE